MSRSLPSAIKFLTVYQWRKIDEDYKTEERLDWKVPCVLLCAAVVLVFSKYLGKSGLIQGIPAARDLFAGLPYPGLYPKLYWAVFKAVNYFVLPALVIKLVFKERIKDFGFHLETKPVVLGIYVLMFLAVIPLVFAVSFSPAFLDKYPLYDNAAGSFVELAGWELGYALHFFMLEFFFRGFMLFSLARYMGSAAIFVMVIPYTMIHFTKPMLETMGAVVTGTALGTLALRTRSIYGGVIVHIAIAWGMDLMALVQKGELQKLF